MSDTKEFIPGIQKNIIQLNYYCKREKPNNYMDTMKILTNLLFNFFKSSSISNATSKYASYFHYILENVLSALYLLSHN